MPIQPEITYTGAGFPLFLTPGSPIVTPLVNMKGAPNTGVYGSTFATGGGSVAIANTNITANSIISVTPVKVTPITAPFRVTLNAGVGFTIFNDGVGTCSYMYAVLCYDSSL